MRACTGSKLNAFHWVLAIDEGVPLALREPCITPLGAGDLHEELREEVSQRGGEVSLPQRAHQSGIPKGTCHGGTLITLPLPQHVPLSAGTICELVIIDINNKALGLLFCFACEGVQPIVSIALVKVISSIISCLIMFLFNNVPVGCLKLLIRFTSLLEGLSQSGAHHCSHRSLPPPHLCFL